MKSDDVGSNDDICVCWGELGQDTERYDAYVAAQPWWWRLWHCYVNEWPLRRRFQRQLDREYSAEVLATAADFSMLSTKALQEAYGRAFEEVIRSSDDPKTAMDEIAYVAYQRGNLIDTPSLPRRSSPEEFVMDLWTENPLTLDLLELNREYLPNPSAVKKLSDVLGMLP